jgi:ribonucleoside-diphosphate reductase alpha chain
MHRGAAVDPGSGPDGLENTTVKTTTHPSEPVASPGLEFERFFSREGIDPFDEIEWEIRAAGIGNEKGQVVFEQRDVEMPRTWTQQATNIVVSK